MKEKGEQASVLSRPWQLVGFCLFWTGSLAQRANFSSTSTTVSAVPYVATIIISFAVFALFLGGYSANRSKLFEAIVAIITVASSATLLITIGFNSSILGSIAVWLQAFAQPTCSVLWLAWLIAHGRDSFPRTFIQASLINVVFTVLLLAIPDPIREPVICLMTGASGLLVLTIGGSSSEEIRNPSECFHFDRGRQVLFVFVRILIGLLNALMVCVIVTLHSSGSGSSFAQTIAAVGGAVISLVGFVVISRKMTISKRLILLLSCGAPLLASLPLAVRGFDTLSSVLAVFYWFTAFSFSNIHLFRNKKTFAWSPVVLVASTIMLTSIGGLIVNVLPMDAFLASLDPIVRIAPMMVISYLASMVSILLLVNTLDDAKTEDITDRGGASELPVDEVIQALSCQYRFTPRETEVFELLAKGYSRPYISEALVVSQATVKTHINNIYAKVGVNKHDSLLKIVEEARAQRNEW